MTNIYSKYFLAFEFSISSPKSVMYANPIFPIEVEIITVTLFLTRSFARDFSSLLVSVVTALFVWFLIINTKRIALARIMNDTGTIIVNIER